MRIGRGAGPEGLNLQVIPFRERVDWRESAMLPDSLVWQVLDIFTTWNGSWNVESKTAIHAARVSEAERREENEAALAGPLFGIDQWARDTYLFPTSDPRYNSDGGADHNIQVCVQGASGERLAGAGAVFTSDGAANLQPPGSSVVLRSTEQHGWCNIPIFGNDPDGNGSTCYPPAQGPWSVARLSAIGASDVVVGIGLPWNWHVSTFVVYQATKWSDLQSTYATLEAALQGEAQRNQLIRFNKSAALQKVIFADGYTPNSNEFVLSFDGVDYVAQRAEHLDTGEVRVYNCVVGQYDQVTFVPGIREV